MPTLAIAGYVMVIAFMYLIMSKRLSAFTALVLVPVTTALVLGFPSAEIGKWMIAGVRQTAPTAAMLLFAITFFGIMINVGLFDPVVSRILKIVKGDPMKVIVGTSLMAAFVSLDGDGSTTYMIVVTAMLPLYKKLGINPIILPAIAIMQNAIMNVIPWGGPTARVMAALKLESGELFTPLIPGMIVATAWVLAFCYYLGKKERARQGVTHMDDAAVEVMIGNIAAGEEHLRRPKMFWINILLTALIMAGLFFEWLPLSMMFMVGACVALVINYPNLKDQQERIAAHAPNALAVAGMVFAAGVFTGIMSGSKMVDAIAKTLIQAVPTSMGPHMAIFTAVVSLPFTFFLSNDAFYFGIVPVLAKTASQYGISAAEIGRASLLGQPFHQLSPLVAATYVLVGYAGVNFGDLQRYAFIPMVISSVIFILVALVFGVIPF